MQPVAAPRPVDAEAMRTLALVQQAQGGDGEAFGQLYDSYSETVYRYIYYRVSNNPLAEDLTSETFLRALRRISTFTWQGHDFGAWLVTIARNLVADHFKSSRYRLEVSTGEMLDSGEQESSAEQYVIAYEANVELWSAVARLPRIARTVLLLRFAHGLDHAEIAERLGISPSTARVHTSHALSRLRRDLADHRDG